MLVTAHYDHLGMRKKDNPEPGEDLIFNGAKTMVAAQAASWECGGLGVMRKNPKRSVGDRVFLGRGRRSQGQRLLRPAPGLSPGEDRRADEL